MIHLRRKTIAFQGEAYTIEWYHDEKGSSQALEFFESLPKERQLAAFILFRRMGESGKIFDITRFRNEGDKIFSFKPQPERYLCFFFTGRKIIITSGFEKKSQKLPPREKDRALRAKADFERRINQGVYYGKQEKD
jgi:phage-related protein